MNQSLSRLRWPEWMFLGVIAILPVAHSLAIFRFFLSPQLAVLIVASGALLMSALSGAGMWFRQEGREVRWALLLLAAFLSWISISALAGEDPTRSLSGHTFQGTGLVMWVAAAILFVVGARLSQEARGSVTKALGVSAAVLIALTALWAVFPTVIETTLVPRQQDGVPLPGVGNAAMLAAIYGACALVMFGRWIGQGGRVPLGVGTLCILLAMISQSRVAAVATCSLLLVGAALSMRTPDFRRRAVIAVVVAALAVVAGQVALQPLVRRGMGFAEAAGEGKAGRFSPAQLGSGLRSRAVFWKVAARSIGAEPFFGAGPANFSYPYRRLSTAADIERSGVGNVEVNDAHNLLVEVAATGGIPAALLLAGFILLLLLRRGRARPTPDIDARWRNFAILVLFAVSLFQPLSLVVMPLMAALAGVSISTGKAPIKKSAGFGAVLTALALVVATLVAGSLIWSDKLLLDGSNEWDAGKLEVASSLNPTCQVCLYELGKVRRWDLKKQKKGSFAAAFAPNLKAVKQHPSDHEAFVQLGGGFLFMGLPQSAIQPLETAVQLNRHSVLASQALSVAYLRVNRFESAIPHLQKVAKANPSGQTFGLLAFAAEKAGRVQLAAQAKARSLELDPTGGSIFDTQEVVEGRG